MSQIFLESGEVAPVTLIKAERGVVTLVRDKERDGYRAVQIASGEKSPSKISKPLKGHFGELGNFHFVREFRLTGDGDVPFKRGDAVSLEQFAEGDAVTITGVSKGKGFQGVVKRHRFAGGPRSHGQKHSEREPGSIGAGGVQRVFKGRRMAGRMGGDTVTQKNVKVVKVDAENGILYVHGAVPGRRGSLLAISMQ